MKMNARSIPSAPALVLALVTVLSACAPIPHYEVVAPTVTGTVHRRGQPVANALVYLNSPANEACSSDRGISSRTDVEGRFSLESRKEFRLFMVMDPAHDWQLCIAEGEKLYHGWDDQGIGNTVLQAVFACNLDEAPRQQTKQATGLCTFR
jgi:hypothetical protein